MPQSIASIKSNKRRKGKSSPAKKQTFYPTKYPEDHPRMNQGEQPRVNNFKTPPPLKAQTPNQRILLKKLKQNRHDILLVKGPAGTGKTYMAVRDAISKYKDGDIDKIVITRPNVTTGDDLGFLPGTLTEKMAPWTRPIIDVFNECFSVAQVNNMLASEELEIAPLAYMRGRTFKNCIVIADEMQNATPEQMKMLMTRVGDNCNMVITGDTDQYDRQKIGITSGLADITKRLQDRDEQQRVDEIELPEFMGHGVYSDSQMASDDMFDPPPRRYERIALVSFTDADVVRHPVIKEVLELYSRT